MKKQIAKGLAMLMVTLALAAASAAVANGQSAARLRAHVPFDFIVADQTLRSGEYRVGAFDQSGDTIAIRNLAGDSVVRLSAVRERKDPMKSATLVFHRYGSTYFLSQVWMAGEATGRELTKCNQERAMERELKIASNKVAYEVVEVAAIMR